MACEEPQMTQENIALKVLDGTASYTLAGQAGDTLMITSADGSTMLTFAEVAGP
jgi:heat shock protein HslJ